MSSGAPTHGTAAHRVARRARSRDARPSSETDFRQQQQSRGRSHSPQTRSPRPPSPGSMHKEPGTKVFSAKPSTTTSTGVNVWQQDTRLKNSEQKPQVKKKGKTEKPAHKDRIVMKPETLLGNIAVRRPVNQSIGRQSGINTEQKVKINPLIKNTRNSAPNYSEHAHKKADASVGINGRNSEEYSQHKKAAEAVDRSHTMSHNAEHSVSGKTSSSSSSNINTVAHDTTDSVTGITIHSDSRDKSATDSIARNNIQSMLETTIESEPSSPVHSVPLTLPPSTTHSVAGSTTCSVSDYSVARSTNSRKDKHSSRPSSGRSSPIQVMNHPIMDKARAHTLRPRSPDPRKPPPKEEEYLTYLGVHLDRPDNYYYRPGETIFGQIVLKLRRRVLIWGLDFRLKGKIDVLLFNGKASHQDSETFLYHCHRMIGVWDNRPTQLEPGSYVSQFKYVLPTSLPDSVTKFSNCQLRVAYGIQAILTHVNRSTRQVSKLFLLHSPPLHVPLLPVFHREALDNSEISLKIDSTNLIIGQPCVITIHCELKLTHLQAHLEQIMVTGPHRICEILNKFKSRVQADEGHYTLKILVPDSAMADIKRFTRAVDIQQRLLIKVKYKDRWVTYQVPVKVYPATSVHGDDIPKFDRVKRYPTLESSKSTQSPVQVTVDVETESWLEKVTNIFKTE